MIYRLYKSLKNNKKYHLKLRECLKFGVYVFKFIVADVRVFTVATEATDGFQRFMRSADLYGYNVTVCYFCKYASILYSKVTISTKTIIKIIVVEAAESAFMLDNTGIGWITS